jgi:hypothetical protein
MAKANSERFILPTFRASFPHLFEARAVTAGQTPKYSITMLFPKGDRGLKDIKDACVRAGRAKFGARYDQLVKAGRMRMPFRDGEEKAEYEGYGETVEFASATSVRAPGVVDERNERVIEPAKVYAGCYCRASVAPFAYDTNGNAGVSLGLRNVQFIRDGDRLDGGIAPEAEFDAVEQETSDPMA